MADFAEMARAVLADAASAVGIKGKPPAVRGLQDIIAAINTAGETLTPEEFKIYNEWLATQPLGKPAEVMGVVSSRPVNDVESTLAERGTRYGLFTENSEVFAQFMHMVYNSPAGKDGRLSAPAIHALSNIGTKLARLLTGDPSYYDNWRDIAGYATLMDKICNGEER